MKQPEWKVYEYDNGSYKQWFVAKGPDPLHRILHNNLKFAIEICDSLNAPPPPPPVIKQVYPTPNKVRVYND